FRRWYRESRGTDLGWGKLGSSDLVHHRQHLVKDPENRATCGRCGLDTSRPSIPAGLFELETVESVHLGRMTFDRRSRFVPGGLQLSRCLGIAAVFEFSVGQPDLYRGLAPSLRGFLPLPRGVAQLLRRQLDGLTLELHGLSPRLFPLGHRLLRRLLARL